MPPSPCRRRIGGTIPSETVSTAMKHGWAWKIPLTERFGNGYVYSSQFCSADQAERELRERLGLLDSQTPARHLKMKIGRVTKHWNKNCLAVGLSQGFIEPLEATALLFIQQTAAVLRRFSGAGRLERSRARPLQCAGQRTLRRHARLHRHPLQDQQPHRHRVLARECRQSQSIGAAEATAQSVDVGQGHRTAGRGSRRWARATRYFPGTPSWRGWAFSRTQRSLHRREAAENDYRHRAKSTTCSIAASSIIAIIAKCWRSIPPRRNGDSSAGLLLVRPRSRAQRDSGSRASSEAIRRDVLPDKHPAVLRGLVRGLAAPCSRDSIRRPRWCATSSASTAARPSMHCSTAAGDRRPDLLQRRP